MQLARPETPDAREKEEKSVLEGILVFNFQYILLQFIFSHNLTDEIITCDSSPDEELALVEHLKGMCLTAGAQRELKSLLVSLVMLGEEETARKLQSAGENFQLSQMVAVKLAEDTMSTDIINEHAHTLEHYIKKVRSEVQDSEAFFWRSKIFLSP